MHTTDAMLERAAQLKGELLAYGLDKRFRRAYDAAFDEYAGGHALPHEEEMVDVIDRFLLQHRLPDGRTVLQRFISARGDLPRAERDMLRGWTEVVEGMFELETRQRDGVVATNVIDELRYEIRSTMGAAVFDAIPDGGILVARLVPLDDLWLVSGSMAVFPPEAGENLCAAAAKYAMSHPEACFRNPAKLALARQIQHEGRERFVRHFGADLVVVPGPRCLEVLNDFYTRDAAARGTETADPDSPAPCWQPIADDGGLGAAETVGMIYDEVEGLSLFAEFGLVQDVFRDPDLLADRQVRQFVLSYLRDDSVSPLPFRRLAAQDPERASLVFARLLNRRGFNWDRDGERLLRTAKPAYADAEPLPRLAPLGERLAAHLRTSATPARATA